MINLQIKGTNSFLSNPTENNNSTARLQGRPLLQQNRLIASIQHSFGSKSYNSRNLSEEQKYFKWEKLRSLLGKLLQRRVRYSLQLIKLIYLFPNDSFSQNVSVNSYDKLLFQDENIHGMVKIYETKEMERKIWSFFKLKFLHIKTKVQKFTSKIQIIQKNIVTKTKKVTFDTLRQFSFSFIPVLPISTFSQKTDLQQNLQAIKKQCEKTERIQRKSNYMRTELVENDSTIQRREFFPIVRKVYISPGDDRVRIIYPSSQSRQPRIRYNSSSPNEHYEYHFSTTNIQNKGTESKDTHMKKSRNSFKSQQKYNERNMYNLKTMKNIERKPNENEQKNKFQIRQQFRNRQKFDDYGYLINTVNGNCTINIYDKNKDHKKSNRNSVNRRNKRNQYSEQDYSDKQYTHHCCCCFFYKPYCMPACRASRNQFKRSQPKDYSKRLKQSAIQIYNLGERIEYLKKLQEKARKK